VNCWRRCSAKSSALDSHLPLFNMSLLAEQLRASLAPQRSTVVLIGTFGLLALALASIGLYGVMAYTVSQNTREIRNPPGAWCAAARGVDAGHGTRYEAGGEWCAGWTGRCAGLDALVEKLLFNVRATDPLTFAAVSSLAGAGGAAGLLHSGAAGDAG